MNTSRNARLLVCLTTTFCGAAAILCASGCAQDRIAPQLIEDPSVARAEAQRLAADAIEQDKKGNLDAAIALNQQAIERYRDLPQAWFNIGLLFFEKDMALEASNAFTKAAELMPTDPAAKKALGDVWAKQSYYDDASRFYLEALDRSPTYLPALRESIRADHVRDKRTESTAERIKLALELESDPKWREFLLRQKQLTDRVLKR